MTDLKERGCRLANEHRCGESLCQLPPQHWLPEVLPSSWEVGLTLLFIELREVELRGLCEVLNVARSHRAGKGSVRFAHVRQTLPTPTVHAAHLRRCCCLPHPHPPG